ncbi:MAG: hypothetical protein WAM82_28600 [Thermoanaerobaculia bacterium]
MSLSKSLVIAGVLSVLMLGHALADPPASNPDPSPVPAGELLLPPPPGSPSVQAPVQQVFQMDQDNESDAQGWLNKLGSKYQRIVAVISVGPAKSIVVTQQTTVPSHYIVVSALTLDAAGLRRLLDTYRPLTLVGVHAINGAFLIIFSS